MLFVGLILLQYVIITGFEFPRIEMPPFLELLLLILGLLILIVFFINILTTEKIELKPDKHLKEDILDYE